MTGIGENGTNGRFWAKMTIFDRFKAKMAKTRFVRRNPKISIKST